MLEEAEFSFAFSCPSGEQEREGARKKDGRTCYPREAINFYILFGSKPTFCGMLRGSHEAPPRKNGGLGKRKALQNKMSSSNFK